MNSIEDAIFAVVTVVMLYHWASRFLRLVALSSGSITQCGWRKDSGGQVGLVGIHTERGLGVMVGLWLSNVGVGSEGHVEVLVQGENMSMYP